MMAGHQTPALILFATICALGATGAAQAQELINASPDITIELPDALGARDRNVAVKPAGFCLTPSANSGKPTRWPMSW